MSLILARLTRIEIAGNWGNKPINSLISIFRSWFPQTAATLEQRIATLDVIIDRQADAAAKLLDALVHVGHDSATHIARPKWRDDDSGAGYGATNDERYGMLTAAADRQLKLATKNAKRIADIVPKYRILDDQRRLIVDNLLDGARDLSDTDKEQISRALRHELHSLLNYGSEEERSGRVLTALQAAYDRLAPCDLIIRHTWLFENTWIDMPVRHRDEDYSARQKMADAARSEALKAIFASMGWDGLVELSRRSNAGWLVGRSFLATDVSMADVEQWIVVAAGDLEPGETRTIMTAGLVSAIWERNGKEAILRIFKSADITNHDLAWKIGLLILCPEQPAVWSLAEDLGPKACGDYWKRCTGRLWFSSQHDEREHGLRELVRAERPVTALNACHIDFENIDPELVMQMLDGFLRGIEKDASLPQSYTLQHAIDYLEKSSIDQMRLAQIEFAIIKGLGFEGEHHAESLYTALMSQPTLFVELLCLAFFPRIGERKVRSEGEQVSASNAFNVLHACVRQPGTRPDGTVTKESLAEFVKEARALAEQHDRLETCDATLGEIMARSLKGEDNIFPSEAARDVLDSVGTDEVLNGFCVGCFNKRGVTTRGFFDGGSQERQLALEYRQNAEVLAHTHPRLSAALESMAKTYDRHGIQEDLQARLRREGR